MMITRLLNSDSFLLEEFLMLHAKWFLGVFAAAAMAGAASAQTVLIDPTTNNGSFEFAGGALNTTKIQVWDGAPDVDNWAEWTEVSTAGDDSGVENTGNATDGSMVSFMQPGNATYNMTDYQIAAGDSFVFSWDHVLREDREHTVGLVWDNGGTITSILESEQPYSGVIETVNGAYVIPAGHPSIGSTVGLGIVSPGSYPEIDNFILTVGGAPPVDGDVDGDSMVNLDDYEIIRDNFRLSPATKAQGDLVGPGDIVDLNDFLFWRANNPFPGAAAAEFGSDQAVPEPSTWLLSALGLAALAGYRSRR